MMQSTAHPVPATTAAEAPCGERSFARMAGVLAIVSLPLAVGNVLAMLATVHFDVSGMTKPLVLLHAGAAAGGLWRASMVLDIAGYYLAIVPLVLLLRSWLRPLAPAWVDLWSWCLLAYCLVGAIGGAELATALPTLMRDYALDASRRAPLQAVFTGYTDGVYRGMWNLLEEFLAGVGWMGIGIVLATRHRFLGVLTIVLGAVSVLDSVGTGLNTDVVASTGLSAYLVLAPVWAAVLGLGILRGDIGQDLLASAGHRARFDGRVAEPQTQAGRAGSVRPA